MRKLLSMMYEEGDFFVREIKKGCRKTFNYFFIVTIMTPLIISRIRLSDTKIKVTFQLCPVVISIDENTRKKDTRSSIDTIPLLFRLIILETAAGLMLTVFVVRLFLCLWIRHMLPSFTSAIKIRSDRKRIFKLRRKRAESVESVAPCVASTTAEKCQVFTKGDEARRKMSDST